MAQNKPKIIFSRKTNGRIWISLLMVAIVAVILAVSAVFALPKIAPYERTTAPSVTAIVVDEGGLISKDADLTQVFVTVRYSDGSSKEVALSEMIVSGLDTTEIGTLENVVISYGGFTQSVRYEVVPTTLTLEYVANVGGRVEGDTLQTVTAGGTATTVKAVPDEGYQFAGWSDGLMNPVRTDSKVSRSEKLVAVFEKQRHTVVFFYPDGTTAREELVIHGESAKKVPLPTERKMLLYGYKFVGWSESYDNITADTLIEPIYEKNATDIDFAMTKDIEGYDLGKATVNAYYENDLEAQIVVEANPERIFVGWRILNKDGVWESLTPEGNTNRQIQIADGAYTGFSTSRIGTTHQYVLSFTPEGEYDLLSVRADFVYAESTVTMYSMGVKVNEIILPYGTPIGEVFDVENADLTLRGYSFGGWYRSDVVGEDGAPVKVTNDDIFTAPASLNALWEKQVYRVVFLNGENENDAFAALPGYDAGEGGVVLYGYYQDLLSAAFKEYQGMVTGQFPSVIPTKTDYSFQGWYVAEGGIPGDTIVDSTFKFADDTVYVLPKFAVNQQTVTVDIQGSGALYYDDPVKGEVPVTGVFRMDADRSYEFVVRAAAGYDIVSVTTATFVDGQQQGQSTVTDQGAVYRFSVDSPVRVDYRLAIRFSPTVYEISVTNGIEGASGIVSYQATGSAEIITTDAVNIAGIAVNDEAGKRIEIKAKQGYYINRITLDMNGQKSEIVPSADIYVVVLDRVKSNVAIVISYAEYHFEIELPEAAESGTIEPMQSDSDYLLSAKPSFRVTAKEGYYIKALTVNGVTLNPYTSVGSPAALSAEDLTFGLIVSDIFVNGIEWVGEGADARITSYVMTFDGVDDNKKIGVEFGELYYTVTVRADGVGNVALSRSTVLYGDDYTVTAETDNNYYVYNMIVNDVENIFGEPFASYRTETVNNVTEDQVVSVRFLRRSYPVTFTLTSGTTVIFHKDTGDETVTASHTFAVDAGSNASFTVKAPEGYEITRVSVDGKDEVLSYQATTHSLTFNGISAGKEVVVECARSSFSVNVYLANGSGCSVENEAALKNINYGETASFIVNAPDASKTLDEANISIGGTYDSYTVRAVTTGSWEISVVGVCSTIEVILPFLDGDDGSDLPVKTVTLVNNGGQGTLRAVNAEGTDVTEIGEGGTLTYLVEGLQKGYELRYLLVNGVKHTLSVQADGSYRFVDENIATNRVVEAVYGLKTFTLTLLIAEGGQGSFTADYYPTFTYGQQIVLRMIPAAGYRLISLSMIGEDGLPVQVPHEDLGDGSYSYTIAPEIAVEDLAFSVSFGLISYEVAVSAEGNGTIGDAFRDPQKVAYGSTVNIDFAAEPGYYISSILVNGVTVNPASLDPRELDRETQEIIGGTLGLTVTTDYRIVVTFSPILYRVTIADTVNGSTKVYTEGTTPSDGSDMRLAAGSNLTINMVADQGYHIAGIEINGNIIEGWEIDPDKANNNVNVTYTLNDVRQNVTIRVTYEINYYEIRVEEVNESVNFKRTDNTPSLFGTVGIYGAEAVNGIFTGIRNGTDVRFIVSPVRTKGYYIYSFTITYTDPSDSSGGKTVVDVLREGGISAEGGQYVFSNVCFDIEQVRVVFRRELYSFETEFTSDAQGTTYPCSGTISTTFSNPAQPDAPIETVEGKYEFGTAFNVLADPGKGYERTAFYVNGEDRNNALRLNRYQGTVGADLFISARYTIASYSVELGSTGNGAYAIYDGGNLDVLIWEPDNNYPGSGTEILLSSGGKVKVYPDRIEATYNTSLYLRYEPDSGRGYYLSTLQLNGTAYTIESPDSVTWVPITVTESLRAVSLFAIHNYSVTFEGVDGGYVKATPDRVTWNGSSEIVMTINQGYNFLRVFVNETYNEAMTNAFKAAGRVTLNNITENKVLRFEFERKPYDVTFAAGFDASFEIPSGTFVSDPGIVFNEGTSAELSFSSASDKGTENDWTVDRIVRGGRFGDVAKLYFRPVNGYDVARIEIYMFDLRGNRITLVDSVNQLTKFDPLNSYYSYSIYQVTGAIQVNVQYAIKTYDVTVNIVGNGQLNGSSRFTVEHHQPIEFNLIANYGYHLDAFTINGKSVYTAYVRELQEGRAFYRYSTSYGETVLRVDDALVNGRSQIYVDALFTANQFDAVISIKGYDGKGNPVENTMQALLEGNRVVFGTTSVIRQLMTEGYQITSILMRNFDVAIDPSPAGGVTIQAYNSDYYRLSDRLEFRLEDNGIMDMLDYHAASASQKTLYIYYETKIKMLTSSAESHLFESGLSPSQVPTVGGQPAFTLTGEYGSDAIDGLYEYGTRATFRLQITPAAMEMYQFAGFQEKINGQWTYVRSGENGITLTGEDTMTYVIHGDREFRAVVFRLYTVEVRVHPEYKYTGGSYNSSVFNMQYSLYAKIVAGLRYPDDQKPDISGNYVQLNDLDNNDRNGTFVYKIQSGAYLMLSGGDTISTNPSGSVAYYTVLDDGMGGEIVQRDDTLVSGYTVSSDVLVKAYYNNDVYISVTTETEGSEVVNEGGSVKYFVQDAAVNLAANSLKLKANQPVRIEITPNANYRFDLFAEREYLPEPDANGNKQYLDTWRTIGLDDDVYKIVTETDSATGRITKVTVTFTAEENAIIKIRFWKQINVISRVDLITDELDAMLESGIYTELQKQELIERLTPKFKTETGMISPDGLYDYGDQLYYELPERVSSDNWEITYQFVGYIVNGVNSFRGLSLSYPTSYAAEYVLSEFDEQTNPSGVFFTLTENGYVTEVVACYVPVYNVIIENISGITDENGDYTEYFDTGRLEYSVIAYNDMLPQYYTVGDYVRAKTGSDNTDKTFQMMGKINDVRESGNDLNSPTSPYNTWNDNMLTVEWESANSAIGQNYRFLRWEYYTYAQTETGDWAFGWQTIPYGDPTQQKYTFPLSAVFGLSYLAGLGEASGYYSESTIYDGSGNPAGSRMIPAVRIRPVFQRIERVTITRETYYNSTEAPDADHVNDNPAVIQQTNNVSGSFEYGNTVLLLPNTRTGYRFVGWFFGEENIADILNDCETLPESEWTDLHRQLYRDCSIDSRGQMTLKLNTSYEVTARFVKEWDITIRVVNTSGTGTLISQSAPYLAYYGAFDNQYMGGNENPGDFTIYNRDIRSITLTLTAGTYIRFGLTMIGEVAANAMIDPRYDNYDGTFVTSDAGTVQLTSSDGSGDRLYAGGNLMLDPDVLSLNEIQESYDKVLYEIVANGQKVVEIRYSTKAVLNIEDVYYGSQVKVSDALRDALGWQSDLIKDGSTLDYSTTDDFGNVVTTPDGKIRIENIPVSDSATLSGNFGVKLNGMLSTKIYDMPVGINFSGQGMTQKEQTISMFGGADSITSENMPFAYGGSPQAGDGTEANPYLIQTETQLNYIDVMYVANNYTVSGIYFKVLSNNNIDFKLSRSLCSGGSVDQGFDGYFDGSNSYFNNFRQNHSNRVAYAGLFAKIVGGTVKNMIFEGSSMSIGGSVSEAAGFLAGYARNARIENISISNAAQKSISIQGHIGAVVGMASGNTQIHNVSAAFLNFYTTNKGRGVGGIVGYGTVSGYASESDAFIRNATVNNISIRTVERAGGIVGWLEGSGKGDGVDNATVSGEIKLDAGDGALYGGSGALLGGIVGYNSSKIIENSNVTGTISFVSKNMSSHTVDNWFTTLANYRDLGVGGIVGYNASGTVRNNHLGNGLNLTFTANGAVVGGIVGINEGGSVTDNDTHTTQIYVTHNKNNSNVVGAIVGGMISGTVSSNYTRKPTSEKTEGYTPNNLIEVRTFGQENPGWATDIATSGSPEGGDTSTFSLGGAVGFQRSGTVSDNQIAGNIVINRRFTTKAFAYSNVGGIVGTSNAMQNVSSNTYKGFIYAYIFIYCAGTEKDDANSKYTAAGQHAVQYLGSIVGKGSGALGEKNQASGVTVKAAEIAVSYDREYTESKPEGGLWGIGAKYKKDYYNYYKAVSEVWLRGDGGATTQRVTTARIGGFGRGDNQWRSFIAANGWPLYNWPNTSGYYGYDKPMRGIYRIGT